MKITIEIPDQLVILAEAVGATPEQIVGMFAYDLSQHLNSGGSDERYMAADYFVRTNWVGFGLLRDTVQSLFDQFRAIRKEWGVGVDREASMEDRQRAYDEREKELLDQIRKRLSPKKPQ